MHLNPTGTSRLAKNLLSSIKSFWKAKGCPGIINENNIEPEHPLVFDSEMPTSIHNSVDQPEKRSPDQYKTQQPKPTYYWATKHQFYSK